MNITCVFKVVLVGLLLLSGMLSCAKFESTPSETAALPANTPAYASYLIENDWIQLDNGFAEWPAAPGSASKVRVSLFGETFYGEINKNEKDDAVLFLTYSGGGSGNFYYIAAALQEKGHFRGTNGILLGDRIAEPTTTVQNGLVTVKYLDRKHDEPMAAEPSVLQTRYFILVNSRLREVKLTVDEVLYHGWLTIGHKVRSFRPCDEKDDLWLLGNSPAMDQIMASHKELTAGLPPYSPVFVILSGRKAASPTEGFGADYRGAFAASQLVYTWSKGNCKSDLIVLDSPLPGEKISSPLTISGRARGTWFFEGDFPLILEDEHGNNISVSYATAKGEWMTTDFVDFVSTLEFNSALSGQRGILILKKDNPAGKAEFDNALKIPVNFY